MQDEIKLQQLEATYRSLVPLMAERMRRQWAATQAQAYRWRSVRAVCGVIDMSLMSATRLAMKLTHPRHAVSLRTVGSLLNADGYGLQSNRNTKEREDHPDRNVQFGHINAIVRWFQLRGQPVISWDTKKKQQE